MALTLALTAAAILLTAAGAYALSRWVHGRKRHIEFTGDQL